MLNLMSLNADQQMQLGATVLLASSALVDCIQLVQVLRTGGRKYSKGVHRLVILALFLAVAAQSATIASVWTGSNDSLLNLAGTLLLSFATLTVTVLVLLRFAELKLVSPSPFVRPVFTTALASLAFFAWAASALGALFGWDSWEAATWPVAMLLIVSFACAVSIGVAGEIESSYIKIYTLQQDFTSIKQRLIRTSAGLIASSALLLLIPMQKWLPSLEWLYVLGMAGTALYFSLALNYIDCLTDSVAFALVSPNAKQMLLSTA
ncbi:hypothetical protein BC830DRAFT_1167114 [Chytriomyces sp. MP71]|nr:hypothetical protein BC830DRAFT_1167114 [Chytriomyces sp. MP71]